MRGVPSRVAANVIWVALVAAALVIGALLTYASGVVFSNTYPVSVTMPASGGILPGMQATLQGRPVGIISKADIVKDGVVVTIAIDGDKQVPVHSKVRVLRRSPIGEQALDFEPDSAPWQPADHGATIQPSAVELPAEIPFLLRNSKKLFEAINLDDLGTVVHEAALAVGGRGQELRELTEDSLKLQRTLVQGIPQFQRLIDTSKPVLDMLQAHDDALASSFVHLQKAGEVLADDRSTLDHLVDTGTTTLDEADTLIRNVRANLSCAIADLQSVNDMVLGPSTMTGANAGRYGSKLDEVRMALEKAPGFFHGYDIITPFDQRTGVVWNRVLMKSNQGGGQEYAKKTPTPAVKPGAACNPEAFGVGVQAVRQTNPKPQPPQVDSPGFDYAKTVDGGAPSAGADGQANSDLDKDADDQAAGQASTQSQDEANGQAAGPLAAPARPASGDTPLTLPASSPAHDTGTVDTTRPADASSRPVALHATRAGVDDHDQQAPFLAVVPLALGGAALMRRRRR